MAKILQLLQEKAVFLPAKLPQNYDFLFNKNFEELFFDTPNEGKINALYFKTENAKGAILYFHGNADNLLRWGKIASEFTKFGYDILVMDYRGYGKSFGPRNEKFMYSDAQFCYDYLKNIYGEDRIVVYGRSLGGTFAVKTASENSPKKVILEATFFNLQDMASRWIPRAITEAISPKMTYHFLSNENIKNVKVPLFHLHGNRDFIVPIKSGKKLFETFEKYQPGILKKFIEIKGGSHDDLRKFDIFERTISEILESEI